MHKLYKRTVATAYGRIRTQTMAADIDIEIDIDIDIDIELDIEIGMEKEIGSGMELESVSEIFEKII